MQPANLALSPASPDQHEEFPEGVGFPAPGVTVEIVDSQGSVKSGGQIGQARVKKPDAPQNYLNEPAASTSSFRDGWFYPGDLLSCPKDAPLIFHGRADDLMILSGINILPAAIEDALEGHPDVKEAAAYAVKSRIHGEIPVAAVVLCENARNNDFPKPHEILSAAAWRKVAKTDNHSGKHSPKQRRQIAAS